MAIALLIVMGKLSVKISIHTISTTTTINVNTMCFLFWHLF